MAFRNEATGLVITVEGGSGANGARVIQAPLQSTLNQAVYTQFYEDGSTDFRFGHSGKCLDIIDYGTQNHAKLQQYDCYGTPNQRWHITGSGANGPWNFRSMANRNMCLDVPGGTSSGAGVQLQIYSCNNTSAQNWKPNYFSG